MPDRPIFHGAHRARSAHPALLRPCGAVGRARATTVGLTAAVVVTATATSGSAEPQARAEVHVSGVPAVHAASAADPGGTWWWDAMGVEALHDRGRGRGITIALIDTPLDPRVPELRGRIDASTSPCLADGGGTRSPSATGPAADHGTSMAALLVGSGTGTGPGGTGVRGIAPQARLVHYAVGYPGPRDGDVTCGLTSAQADEVTDAVIASLRAAVRDGADIVNLSITTEYDADYAPALLDAYRAGAIVVAGVDNDTRSVKWPAEGNGVVAVNPVGPDGRTTAAAATDAANLGFAAPGLGVMAGSYLPSGWRSDYLADGSSIATAIVSGGLAALWSAHPDATANQVLQAARAAVGLRRTDAGVETWFRREGSDLPAVQRNRAYGWGIFDPTDAVALDPTTLPDTNPMLVDTVAAEPASADVRALTAPASQHPSPSASEPGTASGSATPGTAAAPRVAPTATDDARGPAWLLALGLAVLLLGLGVLARAVVRRRRTTDSATDSATPTTRAEPGDPPQED